MMCLFDRPGGLWALPLLTLLVTGCGGPSFHPSDRVDADGDGFFAVNDPAALLAQVADGSLTIQDLLDQHLDCDDGSDNIFPGAAELCDGADNDCDAELGDLETDDDGDGYTECGWDPSELQLDVSARDCNDDPLYFGALQSPGLEEVCGRPIEEGMERFGFDPARDPNGWDDNCDGDLYPGEVDIDRDGHFEGCNAVDLQGGAEALGEDCDDSDPEVRPSVTEPVCLPGNDQFDSDCGPPSADSQILWYPDSDSDGDGSMEELVWLPLCLGETPPPGIDYIREDLQAGGAPSDCADNNAQLNGLDEDGDGVTSCDGDVFASGVSADDDPSAYPGASESCDGIDNDLDGRVDQDFDQDLDGSFTDPATGGVFDPATDGCVGEYGEGAIDCDDTSADLNQNDLDGDNDTTCDGDCNDGNANIQGRDFDGDGFSTCAVPPDCDDFDVTLYPADLDGDGAIACPVGLLPADCDDDPASPDATRRFPGNPLQCDGITDSNCLGQQEPLEADDDGDGASECEGDCDDQNAGLYLADNDGDGYSTCDGDCDDYAATRYPGAPVACGDGIDDNDCNGVIDANEADVDQDGSTLCDGDCNDFDASVEALDADGDGVTTCDGDCDDSSASFPADADGDSWGNCPGANGQVDCDDSDPALNWSDADADGSTTCGVVADCDDHDRDLNQIDADGDGQTSCEGDCHDARPEMLAGGTEVLDGLDNDCDGRVDEDLLTAGAVAITELMIAADPVTGDGDGEYVELYNASAQTVDLRGWTVEVSDGIATASWTFPVDSDPRRAISIGAGDRFVLARSNADATYAVTMTDFAWGAALLPDMGGSLRFLADGVVIDEVSWLPSSCTTHCGNGDSSPTFDAGGSYFRTGHAMGLDEASVGGDAHLANDDPEAWCEELDLLGNADHGSPGDPAVTVGTCGT